MQRKDKTRENQREKPTRLQRAKLSSLAASDPRVKRTSRVVEVKEGRPGYLIATVITEEFERKTVPVRARLIKKPREIFTVRASVPKGVKGELLSPSPKCKGPSPSSKELTALFRDIAVYAHCFFNHGFSEKRFLSELKAPVSEYFVGVGLQVALDDFKAREAQWLTEIVGNLEREGLWPWSEQGGSSDGS
jgi:hypothetical protein